jgi:hypothetical protein
MRMTISEFETTVKAKHPNKIFDFMIDISTSARYMFALDHLHEANHTFGYKILVSSHIYDFDTSTVIKDSDGIFLNLVLTATTVNATGTSVTSFIQPTPNFSLGNNQANYISNVTGVEKGILTALEYLESGQKSKTCECGATSVKSNKHSSWCQMAIGE